MAILDWKDDYSVGNTTIDEEHMKLVEMINSAHAETNQLPDGKAASVIIREMKEYAASHFKTEEALMDKYDYPEKDAHKRAHEAFLKQVEHADTEFASDQFVPGMVKIVSFLADWLVKHIMATDKKLGEFLQEKGEA